MCEYIILVRVLNCEMKIVVDGNMCRRLDLEYWIFKYIFFCCECIGIGIGYICIVLCDDFL